MLIILSRPFVTFSYIEISSLLFDATIFVHFIFPSSVKSPPRLQLTNELPVRQQDISLKSEPVLHFVKMILTIEISIQKQQLRGVLKNNCSESVFKILEKFP